MVVEMDRRSFDSLSDAELMLACTEPAMMELRGREPANKSMLISRLNEDQQALCMFRVLYPAASSAADYEGWIAYLLEQPGYWNGVIGGLGYWGETAMIGVLEETRKVLEEKAGTIILGTGANTPDRLARLFEEFGRLVPDCLSRIGSHIRSRPGQFVTLIN